MGTPHKYRKQTVKNSWIFYYKFQNQISLGIRYCAVWKKSRFSVSDYFERDFTRRLPTLKPDTCHLFYLHSIKFQYKMRDLICLVNLLKMPECSLTTFFDVHNVTTPKFFSFLKYNLFQKFFLVFIIIANTWNLKFDIDADKKIAIKYQIYTSAIVL